MRQSCSRTASATRWSSGLVLLIAVAASGPVSAHPELEAQIAELTGELDRQPADAVLLLRRADLYRRHGDLEAARLDIEAAEHHSAPPELNFYQGRLLLDAGNPEAAARAFGSYLETNPHHIKTWILRSEARVELGRYADAAGDLERAITLSDNPSPTLYRRQAAAFVHAGETYWPAALRAAERGLARFPGEVSLLGIATDLALAMRDTAAADAYLQRLPPPVLELPVWKNRRQLSLQMAIVLPAADLDQQAASALLAGADLR